MKKIPDLIRRHIQAFRYVLTVLVLIIIRTGRRPVIFSRFAGMGDIIATFPAALELKKRHPGVGFIYNCAGGFACLPPAAGVTKNVTSFKEIGLVGHWYKFLLAGFYHFSYGDESGNAASMEITIKEFGRPFNVEVDDVHPELTIAPEVLTRLTERLKKLNYAIDDLIVIHPGPSWPVRTWPYEHWVQLLQALRANGFTNIIQVGTGVQNYANAGAETFPVLPEVKSLVDQLSIPEAIALISMARLFIGIDSGLIHLAACTGTSSVGIFGPTTPSLRFASAFTGSFVVSQEECQGCHHRLPRLHWEKNCPYNIRCMTGITSKTVLGKCLAKLTSKPIIK